VRGAWGLLLIAAAGCVDLKVPYPERRFYTIEALRPSPDQSGDPATVLRVRRFSASKMCDGSEFVLRTADSSYESDFYNVFFVPPALEMADQTRRWVTGSGLFGHVVGAGSALGETHILEGNLVALHGDYRKPQQPLAVIEIQLLLLRVSQEPAAALLQKTYRRELPIRDREPASLVRGWSDGLASILEEAVDDVRHGNLKP
jgi:hypothetical protein